MAIQIGEAVSWKEPDSIKVSFDDRQQIIETDGGNVVQDYGHIDSGDTITFDCVFERDDFALIYRYWQDRELVNFTDPAGIIWESCRIKLISYGYTQPFNNYYNVELEIWRI